MTTRIWWVAGLVVATSCTLTSCAPTAWLLRGALGRAALTRTAALESASALAVTTAFAGTAVRAGLSVTEALAIRGATASLLRSSPLRLTTARTVPVAVYDGEQLLLRGTLERRGRQVVLKDDGGGSVRAELRDEARAAFWDAAGEWAGEAVLDATVSELTAANGRALGRDVLATDGEIAHYDADGRLLGRSVVRIREGEPQLRLDIGKDFAAALRADLRQEFAAGAPTPEAASDPPKRRLDRPTLFVGGNLSQRALPDLNGFNAEADQGFVSSILTNGGPSWATHRQLLNIAALSVNGDCREAVSLPAAKVCAVAIGYRAPLRPSFHLSDECPGATEAQALDACLDKMKDQVRTQIVRSASQVAMAERVDAAQSAGSMGPDQYKPPVAQ